MKRVLVPLALLALAIAGGATAAKAAVTTNDKVTFNWAGWVSCANGGNGEMVTGAVDVHDLATSTVNDNLDGGTFQFQLQGALVGKVTGDVYRVSAVTHGTLNEILQQDGEALAYVNTYHLIGPGPDNNLLVREIAHMTIVDDELVVSHDSLSIECG